jgi:hypothetical protein
MKMRKFLRLINNEHKLAVVKSAKGCEVSDTCNVDWCSLNDFAECSLGATDTCKKDYASCRGEVYDTCGDNINDKIGCDQHSDFTGYA